MESKPKPPPIEREREGLVLPTGVGGCDQFVALPGYTFDVSTSTREDRETIVQALLERVRSGPRRPAAPAPQLRHQPVTAPYLYRYTFHDSAQDRECAFAFSITTEGMLESHTHTRTKDGRVGCVFMQDSILSQPGETHWRVVVTLRAAALDARPIARRLFIWSFGRGLRKDLLKQRREIERGRLTLAQPA
jgi:hypothetical protein